MKGLSSAAALALLSHNRSVRGAAQMQQTTPGLLSQRDVSAAFSAAVLGNPGDTDAFLWHRFEDVGACVHGKGRRAVAALHVSLPRELGAWHLQLVP